MQIFHPNTYFDLKGFKHASFFHECALAWELLPKLADYIKQQPLGKINAIVSPGAHIENPDQVFLGKGTIVEAGAYIVGPCWIGENCTIRHGAYIRGNFLCGDHCVIGHATEIKNSLFLDHVHAAHFAYLGDSILGNKVNMGAGSKCANFKLDQTPVQVRFRGEVFATGLRKLGAILGDNVQLGCNSVTNPGTFMGKDSVCLPCVNFGGVVPAHHSVKSSATILLTPR